MRARPARHGIEERVPATARDLPDRGAPGPGRLLAHCPLRGAGGRGSGNLRSALHPFPVERLVRRISKHEICGIVEAAVEGVVEPVCIPTAMVALTYIAPGICLDI